jgi:hypothetical protein
MAAVFGRMPPAALCGNKLMFLRDPMVVCPAMPFAGGNPVAETRTYVDLWRFEADFACAEKFFTHVSLFGLVFEASYRFSCCTWSSSGRGTPAATAFDFTSSASIFSR